MSFTKILASAIICYICINSTFGKKHTLNLNQNFTLTYEVTNRSNRLAVDFQIVANTTGWVAIGLNDVSGRMHGADIFMGGITGTTVSNATYGADYHIPSNATNRTLIRDSKQDWTVINGAQTNKTTTINFWRYVNTNDAQNDTLIQNHMTNLIWSYATYDELTSKHFTRGSQRVNLLADADPGHTIPPPPATGKKHSLKLHINFTLTYEVKNRNNRLAVDFGITANTTGWVAIGLNDAGGKMHGADFFIGGVQGNGSSTVAYGGDYHLPSNAAATNRTPIFDTKQDWTVLNGIQTANMTIINFWRYINTNDTQHDTLIQNHETNLIWSYSATDNVTLEHSRSGTTRVNLLKDADPGLTIPDPPSGASTSTICLTALFIGILTSIFKTT